MKTVPKNHPRYASLKTRELIVEGVKNGVTTIDGLIPHGRGEAFDYLLGEKTHTFAKKAIMAAVSLLLTAKHPVISVNGNTAALVAKEIVALSQLLHAPLEVNLFHASKEREKKIKNFLEKNGAKNVLLPQSDCIIPFLDSNRKFVNKQGIFKADVVFVPLEDGDRAEALVKNGKKVITVDLNPLSRTAKTATVTIVDNIVRAMPLLLREVKRQKQTQKPMPAYNNSRILKEARKAIKASS